MIIEPHIPADIDAVYASNAFDNHIEEVFPVTVGGMVMGSGKLLKAQVADDGKSVKLTMMVDFQN